MSNPYLRFLARRKGIEDVESLALWRSPELASLTATLALSLLRGLLLRLRLGESRGLVLCQAGVRVRHARHVSAGRGLSLQAGCEIVGLSKRGVRFGDRCTVGRLATIRPTNVLLREPGEGLRMGDHSNIGPYSWIGCSGFVDVGHNVLMGPRVSLLAEEHVHARSDVPIKEQGVQRKPITIEDDCWLGAGSSVLAGVTVGTGSIVAAGAVVTRDVEPCSVVGGVPARVIRKRGCAAS